MRLTRIQIQKWRNFQNLDLAIPRDANLVCLVGENGTGKSNLLELLSAISHQLGISPGAEARRGNPLEEPHDGIQVTLFVTDEPHRLLGDAIWRSLADMEIASWDGSLHYSGHRRATPTGGIEGEQRVWAGGVSDDNANPLAGRIVEFIRQFGEINHLYLDADRAYPPRPVGAHEIAQILEQDFDGTHARAQLAFKPTRTLYEQWATYLVAREQKAAIAHYKAERAAQQGDSAIPPFVDHFAEYRNAVQEVLPHLHFVGIEENQVMFDSSGLHLPFDSLSGGEREIAFLLGQIDRFRLTRGLLFLDEPELHLNPDLVRTWLSFVLNTVLDGQVWIATHSLEAVEVAGPESTFVLERDRQTRSVIGAAPLRDRPVLSVLSRALGSPAFSLQGQRFVYVEGEAHTGERERYFSLCGEPTVNRFMEAGNGRGVTRNVDAVRLLREEVSEELVVGGVVDRDFKSAEEAEEFSKSHLVHVLGCHEIENLFLHIDALENICDRTRDDRTLAATGVIEASDSLAGVWIVRWAFARCAKLRDRDWLNASRDVRRVAGSLAWHEFDQNASGQAAHIASLEFDQGSAEYVDLETALLNGIQAYSDVRSDRELWKEVLGKEVLGKIPPILGLSGSTVLERLVVEEWTSEKVDPPQELKDLREYVAALGPLRAAVDAAPAPAHLA